MTAGLADTSIFIASESGRRLDAVAMPDEIFVSVITIGELQAGVLSAPDTETRARRLLTLSSLASLEPLVVDSVAANHWASMRVRLVEEQRRVNVNDLWIAAIARANELPIITQDDDFDVLAEIGSVDVIRV